MASRTTLGIAPPIVTPVEHEERRRLIEAQNAAFDRHVERLDAEHAELLAEAAVADGALLGYVEGERARMPVNVARVMRDGVPAPEMALDGWLVAGELHLMYAEAESWKTWIALYLADAVMRAGGTVAWFDEELGAPVIAERMTAIGADPDTVESRFAYFPFPGWQATHADVDSHRELLATLPGLALVVYDTATDALAEAGLDENSGVDVTRWVKAYPEQARRLGAAQVVLDHVGHSDRGRAVGSRAKKSKAKVQYAIETTRPGNREATGEVRVRLTKNTRGADIPADRHFRVGGGHGEPGAFVWEEVAGRAGNLGDAARRAEIGEAIKRLLTAEGAPLSQNQVAGLVTGKRAEVISVARELAAMPGVTGVKSSPGARGSIQYEWVGPDAPAGGGEA